MPIQLFEKRDVDDQPRDERGRFSTVPGTLAGAGAGYVVGGLGANLVGGLAERGYRGAHRGAQAMQRAGAKRGADRYEGAAAKIHEKLRRAEALAARPGTAGEGEAARTASERLREKLKSTPGARRGSRGWEKAGRVAGKIAEAMRRGAPGARRAVAAAQIATALGATAYGGYLGYQLAKDWNPNQPRDEHGRFSAVGEHLGRVGGYAASVFQAPRVYRGIRGALARRGLRRPLSRAGLAALGAYGAVAISGEVGGYVGRKIDEAGRRFMP